MHCYYGNSRPTPLSICDHKKLRPPHARENDATRAATFVAANVADRAAGLGDENHDRAVRRRRQEAHRATGKHRRADRLAQIADARRV